MSHFNPSVPDPSYWPGLVRGFQMPARRACILPVAASCLSVALVCFSGAKLHETLLIIGLLVVGNHFEMYSSCNAFIICVNFYFLGLVLSVYILFHLILL